MPEAASSKFPKRSHPLQKWLPLAAGIWLGLCLVKLGNPVVLDHLVAPPRSLGEFIHAPWPMIWGVFLFIPVAVLAALCSLRIPLQPRWAFFAAAVWFAWQWLAAIGSVEPELTRMALIHFTVCMLCLAMGYFSLSAAGDLRHFWPPVLLGFLWVLWVGLGQRFGGLESVRDWVYSQPDWRNLPPDYLKRIGSNRLFSTLVYPNAFAGAILLLFPVLLVRLWEWTARLPRIPRGVVAGLFAYTALASLFWTGSKAGWLIGIAMVVVFLLGLPVNRRVRLAIAVAVCLFGLTGFLLKYADYFRRGAPSVDARFNYWQAAVSIATQHPFLGTGPATFSIPYRQIKDPSWEMVRLVHNDYLEQATDAGWVAFIAYSAFVVGMAGWLYRKRSLVPYGPPLWLGCFGWVLQGLIEFGLYIPATSWAFFTFIGLLAGVAARFDSTPRPSAV